LTSSINTYLRSHDVKTKNGDYVSNSDSMIFTRHRGQQQSAAVLSQNSGSSQVKSDGTIEAAS